MCSVGDDNLENENDKCMPAIEKLTLSNSKCNKCREEIPCVVLRGKDVYCKNCFLAGTTHKFKALLGKSRLIRPNDMVLIHYKLGHPSTVLLHFLRTGLDLNTPKKLRFEPVILYIENQYHLNLETRHDLLNKIKQHVQSFGFKLYLISLADYISNQKEIKLILSENNLNITDKDGEKIYSFIDKKASKTTRNEIFNIIEQNLVLEVAKKLECKFVFTPELSVDIASNLLTNVSLGRGSQIALDTGFCDDRDPVVKILRPLRLFDMKELVFYNVFNNLEPVSVKYRQIDAYSSVQNLMKKFVEDLQVNYPATVTTILKTGDKLSLDKDNINTICHLCKAPLLCNNLEVSSEKSTNFSRLVSNELQDHNLSKEERYNKVSKKFDSELYLNGKYCFSCSKISEYIFEE